MRVQIDAEVKRGGAGAEARVRVREGPWNWLERLRVLSDKSRVILQVVITGPGVEIPGWRRERVISVFRLFI